MGTEPWETVQTGNCGSPIETSAGWLVLTHGVGPMRVYSIVPCCSTSADPGTVIGASSRRCSPRSRRAGRLRAQRRVLVRRAASRLDARDPVRDRRRQHRIATADIDAVLDAMVEPGAATRI
jgi:hypothetical protein